MNSRTMHSVVRAAARVARYCLRAEIDKLDTLRVLVK
jgi:hypothetical protein